MGIKNLHEMSIGGRNDMYLPYLSGKNEKKTSNLCAIVDGQARKLTPGIGQRECRDVDIRRPQTAAKDLHSVLWKIKASILSRASMAFCQDLPLIL